MKNSKIGRVFWVLVSGVGLGFGFWVLVSGWALGPRFWCQTLWSVDEVWVEQDYANLSDTKRGVWVEQDYANLSDTKRGVWVGRIERICVTPGGEFEWAGLNESV